ncbi:MAG: hypothetical protein OHK0045_07230 [Raineya sp.]
MQNLQEIALFLDTPIYFIQEERQAFSDWVDAQALVVFFFSKSDQETKNKQGEKVLDKMIAALAAKQTQSPKITEIPITLIEIKESKKVEWDMEKLVVKKIIFFGKETASRVGIKQELYEIFSIKNVDCFVSDTLAEVEAEQSKKMQLWNKLLAMFAE